MKPVTGPRENTANDSSLKFGLFVCTFIIKFINKMSYDKQFRVEINIETRINNSCRVFKNKNNKKKT